MAVQQDFMEQSKRNKINKNMKHSILILLVFLSFTACKNENHAAELNSSKINFAEQIKDINDIVRTVILEDSLNVLKNNKDSIAFCEDLIKLDIYIPPKRTGNETALPPPPSASHNIISIENLLHRTVENERFFTSKDSLYLLQQNSNQENFKLDKSLAEKINLTTQEIEMAKRKAGKHHNYYEMTLPFFSLSKDKAYLELNHYNNGRYGNGQSIFLKKNNGKWTIIDVRETWTN